MSTSQSSLITKMSYILPLVAVIVSLLILIGFATGSTSIIWLLVIVNIVSGPACLFFYLLEVRKGVFKADHEE